MGKTKEYYQDLLEQPDPDNHFMETQIVKKELSKVKTERYLQNQLKSEEIMFS